MLVAGICGNLTDRAVQGFFLKEFEDRWEEIRDEVHGVLKFREHIPGFQDVSPDQYRIARAKNWRTFILYGFGAKLELGKSAGAVGILPTQHGHEFGVVGEELIPADAAGGGVGHGLTEVHRAHQGRRAAGRRRRHAHPAAREQSADDEAEDDWLSGMV